VVTRDTAGLRDERLADALQQGQASLDRRANGGSRNGLGPNGGSAGRYCGERRPQTSVWRWRVGDRSVACDANPLGAPQAVGAKETRAEARRICAVVEEEPEHVGVADPCGSL
jgi:hypothetical protein